MSRVYLRRRPARKERRERHRIYLPYDHSSVRATAVSKLDAEALALATDTIIIGMKPQTIGRVLGVGMRVAGRMAGQRLAANAQRASGSSAGHAPTIDAARPSPDVRASGRTAGRATGSV